MKCPHSQVTIHESFSNLISMEVIDAAWGVYHQIRPAFSRSIFRIMGRIKKTNGGYSPVDRIVYPFDTAARAVPVEVPDPYKQDFIDVMSLSPKANAALGRRNLNGQCGYCNRFAGGRTYEYGIELDNRFGAGWAEFLNQRSKTIEPWTTEELEQLRSAARMRYPVFRQIYFELCPNHYFSRSTTGCVGNFPGMPG